MLELYHNIHYHSNLLTMEQFKTLNNALCRRLLFCALTEQYQCVFYILFNCHKAMTDELLYRVLCIMHASTELFDINPFDDDVHKVPVQVAFYIQSLFESHKDEEERRCSQ